MFVLFFFKQKTAYDMRISDWSSDVCSSDLRPQLAGVAQPIARGQVQIAHLGIGMGEDDPRLIRRGDALGIPAVHKIGAGQLTRLGRLHHAMRLIGMDRLACPARRQRLGRVALPVLALPAYLGDLGPTVALGHGPERRPGLDRLRLLGRSEEHTSELQSLMRTSYAVFCLKKNKKTK